MKKKDKKRKSTVTKILQEHIEHTKDFKNPYAVPGIEKTLTVTPTALINHVLRYYNITHKEAFGRGRTKEIAHARNEIKIYNRIEQEVSELQKWIDKE